MDWPYLPETFGYHAPFDPNSLNISCKAPSAFVRHSPPRDQLPVLREAVSAMLRSGPIERTVRGPYLIPVFLVLKTRTESRFILDCSAFTPNFLRLVFRGQLGRSRREDHPKFLLAEAATT